MYKNKFFADGNSSSSEESSDDEQEIQFSSLKPEDFLRSDIIINNNNNKENTKHIVRSEKEKRYAEIEEIIKNIHQATSIRNINQVYEYFENLINAYDKAHRIIEKEQTTPQFYIQILIDLDNFLNQCWNDENWRNKLDKNNFNKLKIFRQKFHRYFKQQSFENNNNNTEQIEKQSLTDEIVQKLNEIIVQRGKRGTNYQEQLECLKTLRQNIDIEIEIKILFLQITFSFDYLQQGNQYLKIETWTHILDYIEELLTLLSSNINLEIVYNDLITIIHQIDEEFIKILKNFDYHSQDYIERLKDEFRICSIFNQIKNYFELKNVQSQYFCTIYLSIIEHIYYKYDKTSEQSSLKLIDHLCNYIYLNDTSNHIHIRANLCHIYHLALHNYYHKARDLMLISHIQNTIDSTDISTKILYNRTMIQLGLCAFRFGEINEAHQLLVNIQSGNNIKELLGQNIDMLYLPFHMHIYLQLIECIYLISAMIIEIPLRKKHLISKHFYNVLYQAEKQPIFGPPESMREHIIAACHALKIGDWNSCVNFLINDKMNNKIWNLIPENTEVSKMLINKIKEESLRIYLFIYANSFSTISIQILVDMFELSIKQVYSIISKMIFNKELMASIDEINQFVIIHETNSSKLQILSEELMNKTLRLYQQNEKLNNFL